MVKGVISALDRVITGSFNVRFAFAESVDFSEDSIVFETLEGDALNVSRNHFSGSGIRYDLQCRLQDGLLGKTRISVEQDGLLLVPVVVSYDTVRQVRGDWGTPVVRGDFVEIPLTLLMGVQILKKRNIRMQPSQSYDIYGSGVDYSLLVRRRSSFVVSLGGEVRKVNGVEVKLLSDELHVV